MNDAQRIGPAVIALYPQLEAEIPTGDDGAIFCRWCGASRTLEGEDTTPGRRVLLCWTCDVPAPSVSFPEVVLGQE